LHRIRERLIVAEMTDAQRAAMLSVKYRRERDALRAENEELRRKLAEVTK
jgi:hypothetical protein